MAIDWKALGEQEKSLRAKISATQPNNRSSVGTNAPSFMPSADGYRSWVSGLSSFAKGLSSGAEKRRSSFQSATDFDSYRSSTDRTIGNYKSQVGKYRDYFNSNAGQYTPEDVTRILADLDRFESDLDAVSGDLKNEYDYWSQFTDESDYKIKTTRSVEQVQADIDELTGELKRKINVAEMLSNEYSFGEEARAAQAELPELRRQLKELEPKLKPLEEELERAKEARQLARNEELGHKYDDDNNFVKGLKSIGKTLQAALPMVADTVAANVENAKNFRSEENLAVRESEEYKALTREYMDLYLERRSLSGEVMHGERAERRKTRLAEIDKLMAENEKKREEMLNLATVDPDSTGMQMMREANTLRQDAVEDIDSEGGQFLANTLLSVGQNAALLAPAAAASFIPGLQGAAPALASAVLPVMGVTSGAQKAYEVIEAGGSASDALGRGILAGSIEAATEKMGIDNLMDLIKTGGKSAVANMLKQAGAEATEETVSYVMNFAADKAAKDPNATWSWAELAESAASGGLSGLFFGAGGTAGHAVLNKVQQHAADSLTGKELKKANDNFAFLESVMTAFPEGSETRKMAESFVTAMEKSDNALHAVSDAQWGKLYRTAQSELDSEAGPVKPQARESVVQAMHPDEKVMSPTATAFMTAGDSAQVADAKSAIMDRVMDGDTTLKDTDLRKLELQSAETRKAFAELTGVELPASHDTKTLLAAARKAVNDYADIKAKQSALEASGNQLLEAVQQQAAAKAAELETQAKQKAAENATAKATTPDEMAARAFQAPAPASAQTAAPAQAQTGVNIGDVFRAPAQQASPTVELSNGQTVTKEAFVKGYMEDNPGTTQADAVAAFDEAVRGNKFGIPYPMEDGRRYSAPKRKKNAKANQKAQDKQSKPEAKTAEKATPAQSADEAQQASVEPAEQEKGHAEGVDTTRISEPVQSPAEASTEVENTTPAKEPTRMQKLVVKAMNDAVRGTGIKGVELRFLGEGAENGYYDEPTGMIVLNGDRLTSARALSAILGHEMFHRADNRDAKLMDELLTFAEEHHLWGEGETLDSAMEEERNTYIDFYVEEKGMSREAAEALTTPRFIKQELAANIMGEIYGDTDALYQLAKNNRTLFQKARDALDKFILKLTTRQGEGANAIRTEAEWLANRMDSVLRRAEGTTAQTETKKESTPSAEGEDATSRRHALGAPDGYGITERKLRRITSTPEFNAWFHDGNGELRDPKTGLPMVFYHGTGTAGYTRFEDQEYGEPGFWFAKHRDTSDSYYYTGRDIGEAPTKEFRPRAPKTWPKMVEYIESEYQQLTIELDDYTGMYVVSDAETWEPVGTYKPTRDGLKKLDGDLQELANTGELGERSTANPGVYQVFLSMEKPLVVECGGKSWDRIDPAAVKDSAVRKSMKVQGNGLTTTNMVVRAARDAGYDGVIFKSVIDGRVSDATAAEAEMPAEVSAVLEKNNYFGAPNAEAALDIYSEMGFLPGLTGADAEVLSAYVEGQMEDSYGKSLPDDDFVVFDSAQIKSVHNTGTFDPANPDIRYSVSNPYREHAPTFFSKMEQEIAAFKQAKMGATSVVSYLKGHGVKDEEIKWSGIQQFLEGKKSVTREELQEFVRMNTLELEEQVLDGHKEAGQIMDRVTGELYDDMEHMRATVLKNAEAEGYGPDDVLFDYSDYPMDGIIHATIFKDGDEIDFTDIEVELSDKSPRWEEYITPGGAEYRELLYKMPGSDYTNQAMGVHWGGADEGEGVLAHARVQDFKDPGGGDMLFIEEIQSDWHNVGQKVGYKSKDFPAKQQELKDLQAKNRSVGLTKEERLRMNELKAELYPKGAELDKRGDELDTRLENDPVLISVVEKIAEAKFSGNLDYAMNNVFSQRSASMFIDDLSALGVKFTSEESAALRMFIGDVQDFNRDRTAYTFDGGREGELHRRAPEAPYAKNYHEYVLKRLLRKAAEEGYESIGWTTGKMQEERWSSDYAEGYRIEYDQDIPKFLNKYGKQWGAKVEKTRLNNGGKVDTDLIDEYRSDLEYWRKEMEDAPDGSDRRDFCNSQIEYAQKQIDSLEDRARGTEVWTMKLTDAMREDVLYKGQPRYSVSKEMPFAEQVHRALTEDPKENRHRALYIAQTPYTLSEVGLGDLPMCTTVAHVRDINHPKGRDSHWHGLPEGLITRLPDLLQKPVAVLDSDTRPGDIVVVTSALDNDRAPVLVTIHPNGNAKVNGATDKDTIEGPANFITSMYGKERDFDSWLAANARNGKVLYWNKNRAQKLFRLARLQLPAALTVLDSDTILGQHYGYVKENIPTRLFSVSKKKKGNNVKTGGNTGNVNPDTGYERGSLADSFMRVLNTGDRDSALNMLEQAAQQLAQAEADRAEHRKQETVANTFRPKLNEDAIARNRRIIEELIAKYGKMEQTGAAQQEVRLPKQIDEETKVRGFIQTAEAAQATTEDVRNTLDADILAGTAGTTYTPVTDSKAMREVKRALKDKTAFNEERRKWSALVESGQMPTKEDIAKAEAMYVQACAEGQVFEAQKLAAEIAVMGTQAGQVVQAMSLVKRMTPAGQLYFIQKTVDRLNAEKAQKDRNIKLKIDPKLAQQLLAAKDKAEIDAALDAITQSLADQMPVTIYDKWNTWRYLAMLGNPRTHVRNLFGNAIFTPARLIKDVAAMGLEHMVIEDQSQRTKGFADKDLRDFAKQDAKLMEDELRGGGKYDTKEMIRDKRRIFKTAPLHWLEKTNSSLLESEDWIFLSRAYSSALSGFLAARGFTAEQVSGPNSTKEGRAALDAGRVYAINEAKKATYRDASKLAQWLNHAARNNGLAGSVIFGGLVPFTKTPVNIIKRGLEYSPVGLATSVGKLAIAKGANSNDTIATMARKLELGDITTAEFIDSIAAGLTGTALVGLGYALARAGLLVGGLGDDDEDKFEELQGNQEYSIRVGDKSFTIDWMAPTVLPMFVGEALHRFSEQEGLDGWEMLEAAGGLLDPVMALSMLDGLNSTLSAVKYDEGEPIPAILQTILGSYISQGVPSVLGAVARTMDDTRRTSFTPSGQTSVERWLSRLWQNSFVGKTPIAAEGRMAYVDEWGRTDTESSALMRAIENFISPGYINPLKESPLEDELSRLAKATGDNGVYPNKAQKYFSVDKEKYVMTQEEYQEHLLYRGQKSYKLVSDITTSQTYDNLDDKTKAQAVELAYDYAAAMAKVNTTEAYEPDKWMLKLAQFEENGGDAAEYLMLRAQSRIKDLSMTEMVLASPKMPINDAAEILLMERTTPDTFTDPYTKGYEYVMDAGQQKEYEALYRDLYLPAYAELVESPEYIEATAAERKKLISSLGTDINDQTKTEMSDRLFERGIEPTEKQ